MTERGPRVYALHGLRLRSTVALAGPASGDDRYDVDVHWSQGKPVPAEPPPGRLGVALGEPGSYRYAGSQDDEGLWTLRVPGFSDFLVDHEGRTVECRLDPSADADFVAVLVSGLVSAFLLTLGGHAVLHASAVELGGRAIAFAGLSGSGKSTLAALFCAAGARLVTDDVLGVRLEPNAVCVGGSPHLRLRRSAAWALDQFPAATVVGTTADDRLALRPPVATATSVPLSGIVLPCLSREATRTDVTAVVGSTSVTALLGASRVTGWTAPHVVVAQFRAIGTLAARVPVVQATIPWGHHGAGRVVGDLLDQLPFGL